MMVNSGYLDRVRDLETLLEIVREHESATAMHERRPCVKPLSATPAETVEAPALLSEAS